MNRVDALADTIAKWNTVPREGYKWGNCALCVVDYVEARTGVRHEIDVDEEELTVKAVRKRLGKPVRNGEVCLYEHGICLVLPYGGVCGVFEQTNGFGFLSCTPDDLGGTTFMEAE